MLRVLNILAAMVMGGSLFATVAQAAFVKDITLTPEDAERSMREIVRDLSDGGVKVDEIEGIHHPRTSGKASGQANAATIYARVSGRVPSPIPGRPPVEFDEDILTASCEQLEDRRWICSALFLRSLIDPGSLEFDYFFLEK